MNTIRPQRQITEITEIEARECFRIALGYIPNRFEYAPGPVTCMKDGQFRLCIIQNGAMSANDINTGGYTDFFAVGLVDYLRSIGIAFE